MDSLLPLCNSYTLALDIEFKAREAHEAAEEAFKTNPCPRTDYDECIARRRFQRAEKSATRASIALADANVAALAAGQTP